MGYFPARKFRPDSFQYTLAARYRRGLNRYPFLLFGLPFLTTILAGSFFLTPATALRYERHDRRVSQLSKDEELGLGKDRRKVDINEEYYRLAAKVRNFFSFLRSRRGRLKERRQNGRIECGVGAVLHGIRWLMKECNKGFG